MRLTNPGRAVLVFAFAVTAACGTRQPDSAFLQQGILVGPSGNAQLPGAGPAAGQPGSTTTVTGPGSTTGPGGSTTGPGGGPVTGPGGGPSTGPSAGPGGPTKPNYASDVGVTATTIKIGSLFSRGGIFGPDQFTPSHYGASAFFQALNAKGGVNGRTVTLSPCDDQGSGSGNNDCVRKLIDQDKIFALASTNVFKYDGAQYVDDKGVPDVGGQPISIAYYKYKHLYSIFSEGYPRDSKTYGWKGKLYGGTELARWFKEHLGIKKAGVVYYDQTDSQRGAAQIINQLKIEGISVQEHAINLALQNYDSAVIAMRDNGVQGVWDALDANGNQNLCKAMDSNRFTVKAKVSTISTWTATVGTPDWSSPCRNSIYVAGTSRAYSETGHPAVAEFQAGMKRYFPARESKMHQWALEGWAGAMWLTDAMRSCGADLTRVCVEKFMNRDPEYLANGLLGHERTFRKVNFDKETTSYVCVTVAQWQDAVHDFVVRGSIDRDCYRTNRFKYDPQ